MGAATGTLDRHNEMAEASARTVARLRALTGQPAHVAQQEAARALIALIADDEVRDAYFSLEGSNG